MPKKDNPYKLTDKQFMFVETYLGNGMNATQAYKTVYKTNDSTAEASGARLLGNVKVANYLSEKQSKNAEKCGYSQIKLIQELEFAQTMAVSENNPSAHIKATEVKAKLLGLNEPDKSENRNVDKDGNDIKDPLTALIESGNVKIVSK